MSLSPSLSKPQIRTAGRVLEVGLVLSIEWGVDEIVEMARLAAHFGFDRIWINDHPLAKDPFAVLLEATRGLNGIGLGIGTINPVVRHPAVIAASTATVTEISRTTFALGIGSSTLHLLRPLGCDPTRPVTRCQEAILLIRQLLDGKTSSFDGKAYQTEGARLTTGAFPDIPVLVGTSGGPKMLDMSGEVADGIIAVAGTRLFYEKVIERYLQACATSGRAPGQVVVNGNVIVEGTDQGVQDRARSLAAHTIEYRLQNPHSLTAMGLDPTEAESWARDPSSMPEWVLRELVISGSASECAEHLRQVAALGVTHFALRFPSRRDLEVVGREVLPKLER